MPTIVGTCSVVFAKVIGAYYTSVWYSELVEERSCCPWPTWSSEKYWMSDGMIFRLFCMAQLLSE